MLGGLRPLRWGVRVLSSPLGVSLHLGVGARFIFVSGEYIPGGITEAACGHLANIKARPLLSAATMALPPGPATLPHTLLLLPALLSSGTLPFTPWPSTAGGKPPSPHFVCTLGLGTRFRPQRPELASSPPPRRGPASSW